MVLVSFLIDMFKTFWTPFCLLSESRSMQNIGALWETIRHFDSQNIFRHSAGHLMFMNLQDKQTFLFYNLPSLIVCFLVTVNLKVIMKVTTVLLTQYQTHNSIVAKKGPKVFLWIQYGGCLWVMTLEVLTILTTFTLFN